jgi:16S rRNA (cytidine1402-2'-O)-methyltransferase
LARELTKQHEEFIFFTLGQWDELPRDPRGEFTVVIGPPEKEGQPTPEHELARILERERSCGGKPKQVVERVVHRVSGWSRKAVYDLYIRNAGSETRRGSDDRNT